MTAQPYTSPAEPSGAMILTRDDVERLLHDDSSDSRSGILEKVSFQYNAAQLSAREHEIAEHIFRLLMRDMSMRVRETLAERVKDSPTLPRDIVLHMANDVESVAVPVLQSSPALSDADLVSIVQSSHDMEKLIAITRREKVSPRVSGALVETNYTHVLTSLLRNEGAQIAEDDLNHIVTQFADDGKVMEALVAHPNLPRVVVERVITQVSNAVAAELKEKYNLSDEDLQQNAKKVREEYMLRLLDGQLTADEIDGLVGQMVADGSLTPSIMTAALCRGQLGFFTAALARLANIQLSSATRLLADRGDHGFNGIYKKSGLPDSMMAALHLLVRAVQNVAGDDLTPGTPLYANRLVELIVTQAGDRNIEHLPYFIALIRQNAVRR